MGQHFWAPPEEFKRNRLKLLDIEKEVLTAVPGSAVASDQPYRLADLAIDFCEDVPALPESDIDRIVAIFERAGAQAKVSSIHVNAWIGEWDKLSGLRHLFATLWRPLDEVLDRVAFLGDSPNDAPLFGAVPLSVGVANVAPFLSGIAAPPAYIARGEGGAGFVEFAEAVLAARQAVEGTRG